MADFLARASACSLPKIPAWDFTLKNWMGDGDPTGVHPPARGPGPSFRYPRGGPAEGLF